MSDLPRRIGFWGASAVMVGVTIGTGIFRQPSAIAGHLGSPAMVLALWALGGILSLCGALTYAEMATMYPRSGGVYIFLREGLGRPIAFVFGWTYMLISKPFAAAGIAVIFGENLVLLLRLDLPPDQKTLLVNTITTASLVVLTLINVVGVGPSTGLAQVLTGLKIVALVGIIGIAVLIPGGMAANFHDGPSPKPFWSALAPVMLAVLWTYDGWSDLGSIAGEVRDPQRRLPLIYLTGTAAITLLYMAVNAVYIWVVPLPEMRGHESVAAQLMDRLLGGSGAAIITAIIAISALGGSHAAVLTGARVTFAQAQDGLLFRFLGRIHPRYQTPAVCLWVQLLISCLALWHTMVLRPGLNPDGSRKATAFEQLANGFTFTMWIFYGLAACSIFILRVRRPDAQRPFRCWGYPVVPAVFILAAVAMTVLSILDDPGSTLPWVAILIAGLPVYFIWTRFYPGAPQPSTDPGS
jgi:APA family basic amino acid/polyamine antiporter